MPVKPATKQQKQQLLTLLSLPEKSPDHAYLTQLQTAWIFNQPFHNLDLLAGWKNTRPPLNPEQALLRCLAGLGGPCHVQSSGFLQLLLALGFNAHLCGATIGHPNDHLLIHVLIENKGFYVDVGNGQPYLQPFPDDARLLQTHLGWQIQSQPEGTGVRLHVSRPGPHSPKWQTSYLAQPAPKLFADFSEAIAKHHHEPSFGPFINGLRVVRIGNIKMQVLRDYDYSEYFADGFQQKTLSLDALTYNITQIFNLAGLPIQEALQGWAAARVVGY